MNQRVGALHHGNSLLKAGNYAEAARFFTVALESDHNESISVKLLNGRSFAMHKLKFYAESYRDASSALDILFEKQLENKYVDDTATSFSLVGESLLSLGELTQAAYAFFRSYQMAPKVRNTMKRLQVVSKLMKESDLTFGEELSNFFEVISKNGRREEPKQKIRTEIMQKIEKVREIAATNAQLAHQELNITLCYVEENFPRDNYALGVLHNEIGISMASRATSITLEDLKRRRDHHLRALSYFTPAESYKEIHAETINLLGATHFDSAMLCGLKRSSNAEYLFKAKKYFSDLFGHYPKVQYPIQYAMALYNHSSALLLEAVSILDYSRNYRLDLLLRTQSLLKEASFIRSEKEYHVEWTEINLQLAVVLFDTARLAMWKQDRLNYESAKELLRNSIAHLLSAMLRGHQDALDGVRNSMLLSWIYLELTSVDRSRKGNDILMDLKKVNEQSANALLTLETRMGTNSYRASSARAFLLFTQGLSKEMAHTLSFFQSSGERSSDISSSVNLYSELKNANSYFSDARDILKESHRKILLGAVMLHIAHVEFCMGMMVHRRASTSQSIIDSQKHFEKALFALKDFQEIFIEIGAFELLFSGFSHLPREYPKIPECSATPSLKLLMKFVEDEGCNSRPQSNPVAVDIVSNWIRVTNLFSFLSQKVSEESSIERVNIVWDDQTSKFADLLGTAGENSRLLHSISDNLDWISLFPFSSCNLEAVWSMMDNVFDVSLKNTPAIAHVA